MSRLTLPSSAINDDFCDCDLRRLGLRLLSALFRRRMPYQQTMKQRLAEALLSPCAFSQALAISFEATERKGQEAGASK